MRRFLLLVICLALAACGTPLTGGKGGAPSRVTPAQCLATAEAYRTLRWLPTAANVRHGTDADGIRVDTPDVSWRKAGAIPGWWTPGEWQTGMPYQWGGFSTPESFLQDITAGRAGGDVYTLQKRLLLDAGVSRWAAGIDCSGFISRCWRLPRSYSTRELPSLCDPLPSWDALLPGDILNTWNAHVLLFTGWADAGRTAMHTVEAGRPPHWLVMRHTVPVARLRQEGFTAMRYRGMVAPRAP